MNFFLLFTSDEIIRVLVPRMYVTPTYTHIHAHARTHYMYNHMVLQSRSDTVGFLHYALSMLLKKLCRRTKVDMFFRTYLSPPVSPVWQGIFSRQKLNKQSHLVYFSAVLKPLGRNWDTLLVTLKWLRTHGNGGLEFGPLCSHHPLEQEASFLKGSLREEETGYQSNGDKVSSFTRREMNKSKLIKQQGLIHSLSGTCTGTQDDGDWFLILGREVSAYFVE